MSKKPRSSAELADCWKSGLLPLRIAARRHIKLIGLWPVNDTVWLALEIILGYANLGLMDTPISVSDTEEMLVGEIIDRYKLEDFLG
jgi:hypothetical protein